MKKRTPANKVYMQCTLAGCTAHTLSVVYNGKPFKETEPIVLKTGDSSAPILIRLVNAGQWQQEISFPKNFRLQLMDNGKALLKSKRFQQLILAPRETCELLVHPPFMDGKDRIKYIFRDPVTGRIKHRTFLSIY